MRARARRPRAATARVPRAAHAREPQRVGRRRAGPAASSAETQAGRAPLRRAPRASRPQFARARRTRPPHAASRRMRANPARLHLRKRRARGGGVRTLHQRERGVHQLHAHALQRLGGEGDVQQVQNHGLLRAQHGAARNHRRQRIANLPRGAGDQHAHRLRAQRHVGGVRARAEERSGREGRACDGWRGGSPLTPPKTRPPDAVRALCCACACCPSRCKVRAKREAQVEAARLPAAAHQSHMRRAACIPLLRAPRRAASPRGARTAVQCARCAHCAPRPASSPRAFVQR